MNPAEIREALREVIDPELGVNIVDLGLVYAIEIVDNEVRVTMTMTTPACPLRDYVRDLVESTLLDRVTALPEVEYPSCMARVRSIDSLDSFFQGSPAGQST